MTLTAKFCTRRWNLAYSGALNIACQGSASGINWPCWVPQQNSSMKWQSSHLRQLLGLHFNADVDFACQIKNVGLVPATAVASVTGINSMNKVVAAGDTWNVHIVGSLTNVTDVTVTCFGGNSNFRILSGSLNVNGNTL